MTLSRAVAKAGFAPFAPGLAEVVRSHARWRPSAAALATASERLDWAGLWSRIRGLARALRRDGLESGQVAAVLSGNHADTVIAYLGVIAAGGAVAPLSNQVPPASLRDMIVDANARYLIADADGCGHLGDSVAEIADLRRILVTGGPHSIRGWTDLSDVLGADDGRDPEVAVAPNAPFSLIYTSGTTGTPKGMVHDHRARLAFASRFAQAFSMTADSVVITATALFTTGTWLMLLPALHAGSTLVILPGFAPATLQAAVREHSATHTFLVPTAYEALLNDPAFDAKALRTMQRWVSAGSSLRPDTKRAIDARLPGELIELYGCSEGFTTVCGRRDRMSAHDVATVGYAPFGWDVRAVREDGTEASPGELGELVGLSEFMLSHYHNRPEATAEAIWRDKSGRTFIRSGDIGRVGEDGQVYVVDRKKDMINSGGMNVFAVDIEDVLLQFPEIREAAVVAAPHEKWGEAPVAYVVPRDNAAIDAEELRARTNEKVAKYQRLARVILSGPLPRNALGKVLKLELRAPLWANAIGQGGAPNTTNAAGSNGT